MKSLLHFFMFLLHFCLVVHANVSAQSQCHEDDLSALLQLKKKSLPDGPKVLSWNSSTACCSWVGVSCNTDGHVIGLDISNEFIASQIDNSSSLFDLQHLQSLNMSDNIICPVVKYSQIPSAIGKLTNLRYLNLAGSCYSGQVPIEIAHLTKLAILDLSDNDCGYDPLTQKNLYNPNLSTIVQSLTELIELYLDGVNMSALDTQWCQSISSSLPRLQVLSLSSCNLSGPIDPSLAKLQSLSVIRLDDNNKLRVPVPGVFANLSNLTSLSLRSCMMRGTFPIDIFQVPTLQTIDLSDNPQLHGSLPEFSRDGSLQSLVLKGTNFSGLLPDSIGNLRMLSLIDLTGCSFTGPIPKSIQNLTKLVHLHMSSNKFNGSIDSIEWENLVRLQNISLDLNLLNGGIPSSIFSPPLLEELLLSHNQFSGQLHEFSNVSSYLATIDLSFNYLEGVVPVSIYSLRGLEALNLSSNNFSVFPFNGPQQPSNLSTIDVSFNSLLGFYNGTTSSYSSFPQIRSLRFASNKLRTFPDFFRNHIFLYELDLSANQIQGMIPNWIWGLTYLSYLNLSCNSFVTLQPPLPKRCAIEKIDLHSNQLQGQIPVFLPSYILRGGLKYVDYSQNKFSSSLPTDIGHMLFMTKFLSLSSNNLHGAIPVSICNGPFYNERFEHLDMSNNSLSGNVPECLLAMSNLRTLNVGNNNLSGAISNSFDELCGLLVLDLGRNQMEGPFPKSLANCGQLEILNLGNNHMIDTFPCFLKKISTLRVLVLRSNKLYGGIGCSKTNGSWPKLQIIDLSHNSFSGEILGRSFTTWHAMKANDSLSEATVLHFPNDNPHTKYIIYGFGYRVVFDYYASITVIGKGLEMELVKIITGFTLIDFSGNKFNGSITTDFGGLKSLYFLNLSNNAFTGEIPSSLGNLQKLESLDLSRNKLRGQIPPDFAKLTFLAFLNLSNNQLVGRIPTSTQFSTFPNSSFLGNKGLWGPPLTKDRKEGASPPIPNRSLANSGHHEINWDLIIVEVGFAFGFGVAVCSLVFCRRWSKWYHRTMYKMVVKIFPQLEERIGNHRRHVHINQRRRN